MQIKTRYKLPPEAIDKINPGPVCGIIIGDPLEQAKAVIAIYAMQDHSQDHIDAVYTQMWLYLNEVYKILRYNIRKEYYKELKDQDNPILEFNHTYYFGSDREWDFNRTMAWKVKWFTQQAILVSTADYYDNVELFNHKDSLLEDELGAFIECMGDVIRDEIEDELTEFKIEEEEV